MELKNSFEDAGRARVNPEGRVREFFDHQAATFERRAGLPEEFAAEIARAVVEIGEAHAGDLVVELGPGTGQIGRRFSAAVRYVGLDLSIGMLKEFRARLDAEAAGVALIHADAQSAWPLAEGSARVVFSSRAVHLLDEEHVAREMFRVSQPEGATLIIGRVRREPQSVRSRMAREMNRLMRLRGFEGRGGEGRSRKLLEACSSRGAKILEAVEVASWTVSASPQASLDSWRSLSSLGGIDVPAHTREEILAELESWAAKEFGALDRESESLETYTLCPIRCAN
ncbi:MAG TPA: class I SAM-dependent methyltransferase [Pyrinomonadaceae bacterium]|nr:class I SAM-dependent methyltransferase [Pyrinomonadaceae bacterium]